MGELATLKSTPDVWSWSGELEQRTMSGEAQVNTDGTTVTKEEETTKGVLYRTSIPYERVRSSSSSSSPLLDGWAEFLLFDGLQWKGKACSKTVPTFCAALRMPATSLCAGVRPGLDPTDIDRLCGTDIVASVVQLKPGTIILPHCGTTNRRLILHWCLEGCDGVEHTVGGVTVKDLGGGAGSPIIFDDSFEHTIQHKGSTDAYFVQAVLAHPDAKKLDS